MDQNCHILVVDDHSQIRFLYRRVLESAGYTVTEAADGVEALESMESQDYDLIITDWDMPGMGGEQLLSEVAETPYLVVSASSKVPARYRSLGKPIRPRQLVHHVQALLPKRTA
ncbi:MAG: response regulator [Candidatus Eremiobacteraeota bacterium]|nr:response regulator [Candidatus Eremiobacteraeota bacterium]